MSRWRRIALLTTLALLAVACGDKAPGGLEGPDPLHDHAIKLPPPNPGLPPVAEPEPESHLYPTPRAPLSEGIFPCSRCHVGGQPAPDERPAIPHLVHLERDLECGDCHDPDETGSPKVPEPSLCFECHEDLASEPERVRKFFESIRTEDGGYAFTRRWKTRDVDPVHAKHAKAEVECAACHGPATYEAFEKPKSVPLMQRCLDCHAKRQAPQECEACHAEIRAPMHENIKLRHAETMRGCFDCHNPDDRDTLRLANGAPVPFSESYLLCGQCHGPKLRDWKMGLHGKRTGMWNGRKEYLLCVHCHQNPHVPAFPKMTPVPPPMRPGDVR